MKIRKLSLPSSQELALMFVTMLWGATYLILHQAMSYSGPLFFVGIRFLMAAFFVGLLTGRRMLGLTRAEIGQGALIGVALMTGYVLQSAGLKDMASSRSAFITALYVPLVPILQWVFMRRPPSVMSWIGIGLAFLGLIFLAGPESGTLTLGHGEILTLMATVAISLEILLISRYALEADSRRITVMQLIFGGVFSLGLMPLAGEHVPGFSWVWLSCAVALGGLSAVVQLVMNWAQKSVSATRATVIYAGEPVWGGLVGRLAGEPLPPTTILGAGFIVAGVITSELRVKWPRSKARRNAPGPMDAP